MDMRTRLRDKTAQLLNGHKVPELSSDIMQKLDDIIAAAEARVTA